MIYLIAIIILIHNFIIVPCVHPPIPTYFNFKISVDDKDGQAALRAAAENGHSEVVAMMLNISFEEKTARCLTPGICR